MSRDNKKKNVIQTVLNMENISVNENLLNSLKGKKKFSQRNKTDIPLIKTEDSGVFTEVIGQERNAFRSAEGT